MNYLIRGAILAAVLYLGLLGFMLGMMYRPPAEFAAAVSYIPDIVKFGIVPFPRLWNQARGGNLRIGDLSPDFDLPALDKQSRVRLSSFRGQRPVVLVFGSYT